MSWKDYLFEKEEEKKPGIPTAKYENIPVVVMSPGAVDPKIKQHFTELMDKANIPGPDYYEFNKAVSSLSGLPEAQAYQSVYSGFKVMGVTKEKLIASIDTYVGIIKGNGADFQKQVDAKTAQEVTSKRNKILENNNKMTELSKQIEALRNECLELNNQAQQAEMNINQTMTGYQSTASALIQSLEADKLKITNYIS